MDFPTRETTSYSSQSSRRSPRNNTEFGPSANLGFTPYTLQVVDNDQLNHTVAPMAYRSPQIRVNRNIRHNQPVVPKRSESGDLPQVLYNIIRTSLSGHIYGYIPFSNGYDELVQSEEFEELAGFRYPPLGKPLFADILEMKDLKFKITGSSAPTRNQRIELRRDRLCKLPRELLKVEDMRQLAEFWQNDHPGATPEESLASFMRDIQTIPEIFAIFNTTLGIVLKDHLEASNPYIFGKLFNSAKLVDKLKDNAIKLKGTRVDLNLEVQVLFLFEIMSRCAYIAAFLSGHEDDSIRSLGPSLALDCWLYEMEILSSTTSDGKFDPMQDDLVRMYGLGKKELRWLQNNRNPHERREQLRTLEQYHLLKSYLGAAAVEDIREQLCFCFFEIRNVRELHSKAAKTMPHVRVQGMIQCLTVENQQAAVDTNMSPNPVQLQWRGSQEVANNGTKSMYVDQWATLNAHRHILNKRIDEVSSLNSAIWGANGDPESFYLSRDRASVERTLATSKPGHTPGFNLTPTRLSQLQQRSLSDSGKSPSLGSESNLQAGILEQVLARKREFKITRIMVDRLWAEVKENGARITKPVHRKQQEFANDASPPSTSNWEELDVDEKRRLLGCPTDKHPEHPEFEALARKWLQVVVPVNQGTFRNVQPHSNICLPYSSARLWTGQSELQQQSDIKEKGEAIYQPPPAQAANLFKDIEAAPNPQLLPNPNFSGNLTSYTRETTVAPSAASGQVKVDTSSPEKIFSPIPKRPLFFGRQWRRLSSEYVYSGPHTPSLTASASEDSRTSQSNLSAQGATTPRAPAESQLQNQVLPLFNSNARDWYPRSGALEGLTSDAGSSRDAQPQAVMKNIPQSDRDDIELVVEIGRMSRAIERMLSLNATGTDRHVRSRWF